MMETTAGEGVRGRGEVRSARRDEGGPRTCAAGNDRAQRVVGELVKGTGGLVRLSIEFGAETEQGGSCARTREGSWSRGRGHRCDARP